MKTRPRIRRATLWGGAVVSVVLMVLWVGSMVWVTEWQTEELLFFGVGSGSGAMAKRYSVGTGEPIGTRFGIERGRAPLSWLVYVDGGPEWTVRIPLWMPLVVSLGVTAAAWRLEVLARRRARVGKCASCGYDRAGLKVGAVCPECGAA